MTHPLCGVSQSNFKHCYFLLCNLFIYLWGWQFYSYYWIRRGDKERTLFLSLVIKVCFESSTFYMWTPWMWDPKLWSHWLQSIAVCLPPHHSKFLSGLTVSAFLFLSLFPLGTTDFRREEKTEAGARLLHLRWMHFPFLSWDKDRAWEQLYLEAEISPSS